MVGIPCLHYCFLSIQHRFKIFPVNITSYLAIDECGTQELKNSLIKYVQLISIQMIARNIMISNYVDQVGVLRNIFTVKFGNLLNRSMWNTALICNFMDEVPRYKRIKFYETWILDLLNAKRLRQFKFVNSYKMHYFLFLLCRKAIPFSLWESGWNWVK